MQTFLPYQDFEKSAKCLDTKKLGKQRSEVWQIYKTLATGGLGWRNHPAVLMWMHYEKALLLYGMICNNEWKYRGYKDNLEKPFLEGFVSIPKSSTEMPWWLGKEEFHASHKSNLLRSNPEFYSKYGWTEPANLLYWWPTKL